MITSELIGSPVYSIDEITAMPAGEYADHQQPTYRDRRELGRAAERLVCLPGLTTPDNIHGLRDTLADVGTGYDQRLVVVEGRCNDPVGNVAGRIGDAMVRRHVVEYDQDGNPRNVIHIARQHNSAKPRSSAIETINGVQVVSYMGDAVNGMAPDQRDPDPQRMVIAAEEALQMEQIMRGQPHVPAAHEALLLPFERSFVRQVDGKRYLLSADLPWIGMRTNGSNGRHWGHVELLQDIENPVGVKIGASSDADHIKELVARLDGHLPGKLTFMLRVGPHDQDRLPEIIDAIHDHAPESVLLYDIHGTTTTNEKGQKVRAVRSINAEIISLAALCASRGRLHGVHLETIGDSSRRECVETPDQEPTHPGGVDPQLNPPQFAAVLDAMQAIR